MAVMPRHHGPAALGCLLALLAVVASGAAQAHAFAIVVQTGAGEMKREGPLEHAGDAFFSTQLGSATSSVFSPLLHPLSWLDEQLEALDALHQASMENFMIRSLEAKQLRDMAPQEVEGEMLQRVGCQRLREAMLQRHGEDSDSAFRSDDPMEWMPADKDELNTPLDRYEDYSANEFAYYSALGEDMVEESDGGSDALAWTDDNADARTDVVDLLSLPEEGGFAEWAERQQQGLWDRQGQWGGAAQSEREEAAGEGGEERSAGGLSSVMRYLALRGTASEHPVLLRGGVDDDVYEDSSSSSSSSSGCLGCSEEVDAMSALQDDEDYVLFKWPEGPPHRRNSLCAHLLDRLMLLRSALSWYAPHFPEPHTFHTPTNTMGARWSLRGAGAILTWQDVRAGRLSQLLMPEHFDEEGLSASLVDAGVDSVNSMDGVDATRDVGVQAGEADGVTQQSQGLQQQQQQATGGQAIDGREEEEEADDAAWWVGAAFLGSGASAGMRSPSHWLDLNGDGRGEIEWALFKSDGSPNWQLLPLLLLLLATACVAASFVRALTQLRRVMAATGCAGRQWGWAAGRQGHVLVPVTVERDGELVQALMLLSEDEEEGLDQWESVGKCGDGKSCGIKAGAAEWKVLAPEKASSTDGSQAAQSQQQHAQGQRVQAQTESRGQAQEEVADLLGVPALRPQEEFEVVVAAHVAAEQQQQLQQQQQ